MSKPFPVEIDINIDDPAVVQHLDTHGRGLEVARICFYKADPKRPGKKLRHTVHLDLRGFYNAAKPTLRVTSTRKTRDAIHNFAITPWVEER